MKVSVSLSADDLRFVDQLAADGRYPTRSAAVSAAIRSLRNRDLESEYSEAFSEWSDEDADLWSSTTPDGSE